MTIRIPGEKAPHFNLPSLPGQTISLADFQGQPVVLVFYPADWSPVCTNQLNLYNEIIPEFQKYHAAVLAISVDGLFCHQAFAQDRHLHFSLLSDFEPKGKISQEYGVYDEKKGMAERALFVIDKDGIIRWSYVSPKGVNPGAEGILKALSQLKE